MARRSLEGTVVDTARAKNSSANMWALADWVVDEDVEE